MFPLYITDEPYEVQYKATLAEWKKIRQKGAEDPTWSDGQWLNLLRSKILRLYNLKRKESKSENLPGWEIPEKVSFDFTARRFR